MDEKLTNIGDHFCDPYIPISFVLLKKFSGMLPFDIYVKRSENAYSKIFKYNDAVDWERVNRYAEKVDCFYVDQESYRSYLLMVEQMVDNFLASPKVNETSLKETTMMVKEMVNLAALDLIVKKTIDRTGIDSASKAVMTCILTLDKEPKALFQIIKMFGRYRYIVKHSITVSILSIVLAKARGLEARASLNNIGLGGFLHDIGISKLSFNAEERHDFTPDEWKEMKTHPEIGKRLLDRIPSVSTEVKMIVLQHHEQPNGNGYPNGIRDYEIYMPSKIVSIADSFSSLITKRPFREAMKPIDALSAMKRDNGKFDSDILQTFCGLFIKTS